jgi:diguanylate cyclase (GGDEF)-like protein/PAS domain S-box-containing protein
MNFSDNRKLLYLLAGSVLLTFGAIAFVLNWVTESQQAAAGVRTTQTLLLDIGNTLNSEREKLKDGTLALAGRGDVITALTFLASQPAPEHLRQRVLEAEKKKLAIELSKHAETLRINEIGIYDGEGQLLAFTRKSVAARDGYAIGIGSWKDCKLQLTGSNLAGLDWIGIDRPAGLATTTDEFGRPAAFRGRMLHQDDGLLFEAVAPVKLMGGGQAKRIGWVRATLSYPAQEAGALAQQRGMDLMLLFSGRFNFSNPLGLQPDHLFGAWPILDGIAPSVPRHAGPAHPRYFVDSATLGLDNGETLWFVAMLDRQAAAREQQSLTYQALSVTGSGLLLILLLALWLGRRWIGREAPPLPVENRPLLAGAPEDAADRWEYALEGTGHGVWDLNPATGEVVFSPAWRRMLGYSPDDVPNTLAAWRGLIHPEDQPKVRMVFENLLRDGANETIQVIYRMRTKVGDYRWVMTSAHLMRDATGRPRHMIGTNTDITEQREMEQRLEQLMSALNESEAHFRRFFDEAKAVMLLIDPADGRIIDANPAASVFYGYSREELLALHITDINQMTQEDVAAEMAQALAAGREQSINPHRLKNGELRTVEVYSSPYQYDNRLVIYAIVHDISERIQAERALREAATVFESTAEAIMITDTSGVIRRINQAFTNMTGFSAAESLGQTPRILKSGRQDELFYKSMWERLMAQGRWEGEVWNKRKNGDIFPVWQIVSTVRDEQGKAVGFVSLFIDITQKKRDEDEIAYRANYDALTGLPNRNLLAERLGQALKQARREGSRVAVMFVDLDFFKQVNDTLGHAVGDRLLQLVAERMRMCVRETDTIARLGGDEFVILLMDIDEIAPAGIVAEKLIAQMAEVFTIEGNEIHIGASIGITIFPDDGHDIDTLFRNADLAMYRAKTMGRNNAQFFEAALTTAALDRRALENDLRGALSRHEFRLHFLPLIDLATNQIMGVEALLRWQHPQRGLLDPGHFVPLAEETGLIREIGTWALDEACRQLAGWEATGHRLTLALNVSIRQLPEALSVKNILAVLYKYGLEPGQIVLEITESVLLAESPAIQQWFVEAGAAGLHLSIDDFGTGYSSLAYLKRFPVRHVKIDKTFVKNMEGDAGNRALVEAILAMAHSLGLSVVAEGVEEAGQASLLQARSCELAQGYLYSHPLPADELAVLLGKPRS